MTFERVDRETIDRAVPDVNHQGVVAFASPYPYAPTEILEDQSGSMLALDHLVDPQNVGTLLTSGRSIWREDRPDPAGSERGHHPGSRELIRWSRRAFVDRAGRQSGP